MTYIEPFLANQLKSSCSEGNRFMDSINAISSNRVGRKITGTIGCTTTGIQEKSTLQNFSVFPNPTEGKFLITFIPEITSSILFEIYDLTGRLILQTNENGIASNLIKKEIDLSHLNNGCYILNVRQNDTKNTYRILKH
jgi:hypothetical protein